MDVPARKLSALERVKQLVSKITYKPGWKIEVTYGQMEWTEPRIEGYRRIGLKVEFRTVDVFDPSKTTVICNCNSLYEYNIDHLDDKQIVEYFIRRAIYEAEDHEFKEWFKFDGICVFDPHPKKESL